MEKLFSAMLCVNTQKGNTDMMPLINRLTTDHENIRLLLNYLSSEMVKYRRDITATPNIDDVYTALKYLKQYQGKYHHPIESKASALLKKSPQT